MRRRQLLEALLAASAAACTHARPEPTLSGDVPATRDGAREELAQLAARYEQLMREHGLHEWSRYAGKLQEGTATHQRMEALRKSERDVFEEAGKVLRWYGRRLVSPRQAELWKRGALGLELMSDPRSAQLADRLEAVINGHRFELDGKQVTRGDLAEMQRSKDQQLRRRTRSVQHQLHVVAAPIARELLMRRRELASELGLRSFRNGLLELRGVHEATMMRLFRELDMRTRRSAHFLRMQLRRRMRGPVGPWDVDLALERLMPIREKHFDAEHALPRAFALYRAFGIDLENPKLDITIRDFAFGGQTISISIPDDVRLVVRPTPGVRFYSTLVHELGHAYAGTRTRVTEPVYKGYEWVPGLSEPAFAEGLAEVFGRLFDEPEVLTRYMELPEREARQLARRRRVDALLRVRRLLGYVAFERMALENPTANLDALSIQVERGMSSLDLPRDTEPVWATSPFLATYPVYTQSYVLATLVALQVRGALKQRFGQRWISPEAGRFLTDHFVSDGARWTLREKLIATTGRPLEAQPLLDYLVPREPPAASRSRMRHRLPFRLPIPPNQGR